MAQRFQTFIDNQAVTDFALEGSVTFKLNRPAQFTFRLPIQYAMGGCGSRVALEIDNVLRFHGTILTMSDEGTEDTGYTEYVAQDPMELWRWRYARDADGDLSDPDFFFNKKTGPQIMKYILQNSEDDCVRINPIDDPPCDGDLFLEYGFFEGGGVNLSGSPTNFPMTIAEVAATLTSTGSLDIVLRPIYGGSNMAQVNCYNGDYGTNRANEVHFQYAIGEYNVSEMRQVYDMTTMCNKLEYLLGPKWDNQHWQTNIDGSNPFNPFWSTCETDGNGNDVSWLNVWARAITEATVSQLRYGVRNHIQMYDQQGDEAYVGQCLLRKLWLTEQIIRSWPRHLVHMTPVRGFDPNSFDIGDIVRVSAGGFMRNQLGISDGVTVDHYGEMVPGGWTGTQRIFDYTVSWDTEGVPTITDIVTTPTDFDI